MSQIRHVPYGSVYRGVVRGAKCYAKMSENLAVRNGKTLGSLFMPGVVDEDAEEEKLSDSEEEEPSLASLEGGTGGEKHSSERDDILEEQADLKEEVEDPEEVRRALDAASEGGWDRILERECGFRHLKARVVRLLSGDLSQFAHLIQGAYDSEALEESLTQFTQVTLAPFVSALENDLQNCVPASDEMHDLYVVFSREEGAAVDASQQALGRVVRKCHSCRKGPGPGGWPPTHPPEKRGARMRKGRRALMRKDPFPPRSRRRQRCCGRSRRCGKAGGRAS